MSIFKHPAKAIAIGIIIILIGAIAGISALLLSGSSPKPPATPLQKLQHDGYSQAPGISNNSASDIGLNVAGRAEWASQGCAGESGFRQAITTLHDSGKISVNCSQGFLVVNADSGTDLLNFAASLGV
jgi:hypothetical protein